MTSCITKCLILTILSIAMRPGILILAQQQVPCYFVFGDDMFDNGNNNNLITRAKANYLPYGIDSIYGITGRFTNDANIPDIIAQRLRFPRSVPPFATAGGSNAIVRGVNYASGAAGILDETSYQLHGMCMKNNSLLEEEVELTKAAGVLADDVAMLHAGPHHAPNLRRCLPLHADPALSPLIA